MNTASDRERFCQILAAMPLIPGDVIVVLSGDGVARLPVAIELLRRGGAPTILITGGLSNPPHSLLASELAGHLMGLGLAHDRILTDDRSKHTQEQASATLKLAKARKWKRILLVASSYHMPRAYLTFLKVLIQEKQDRKIHMVPCPASNAPWFESPEGRTETRADLIGEELTKIDTYREHVATYAQGIDYLRFWEQGPPAKAKKTA